MRKLKVLGVAIIAVVALSAIASATASAALPEFLPGNAGEKFKGKSGSGTLEVPGEGPIICSSDEVTGENVGSTKKNALALITFKGCKVFSIINAASLGDAAGTILVHAELELCVISTTPLVIGVLTEILPVHIEVFGKLLVVTGDQVANLKETKTSNFTLTYKQKEGKPEPDGCLNAAGTKLLDEHYTTSINEGAGKQSGEQTTEETTYEKTQTLDA